MKRQKMFYSSLICKECGNVFKVPRKRANKREEGHIKDIYCIKCCKTTKRVEDNRSEAERRWDAIQEELTKDK